MKLKIIQFNYGYGGGSATAHLYGDLPSSGLYKQPYLAIHIGYTVHSVRPDINQNTQELVMLPMISSDTFLRVAFMWTEPVYAEQQVWPDSSEYRGKLAHLIANMVANAELDSLEDSIPTVLRSPN